MERLALLTLPISTGLAATLWAMLAGKWPVLQNIFGVVVSLATAGIFFAMGYAPAPAVEISWKVVAAYIGVNILVSVSWVWALRSSSVSAIGFVEIGYPFFILLFSALLTGSIAMNRTQIVGGLIIFIGTGQVVFGESSVIEHPLRIE